MTALLKKDFYQMVASFKLFLVLMVVFAMVPSGNITVFAMIYSVVLSSTSLMSMDESSRWDSLALMMPYSVRQIVLERYVFGWILLAVTLVIYGISQALWSLTGSFGQLGAGYFPLICVYTAIAFLMQAVMTPINFRFGLARARLMTLLLVGMTTAMAVFLSTFASDPAVTLERVASLTRDIPVYVYTLLAAAISGLSIPLSVAGYRKRVTK